MKAIESLFLVLVLAAVAGCTTSTTKTTGRSFDTSKIQDIKKGVTTSNELVKLLGQPLNKTAESANVALWEYSWKKTTTRAATSSGEGVIETDGDQKTLVVLIKNGVVANYTYKDDPFWNERLRGSQ
jgi:outer membrane protein assembly factor BamE (lipoprotein component of BamABCDE complex)